MEITYLPMLLQQDANKLYPDIANFDIVPPPHRPWRVSHTFFLKRRGWFAEYEDFWWDKVIDYLEFWWSKYWLVKSWTDLKLMKDWSATTLFTWTYSSLVNHRLLLVSACSWTKLDSWTWATSNVTSWVYTITDSTKSRTTNAFALKYIYVYEAATWQWQVFRISSNTATELTLERWWSVQPTNIKYHIFTSFSEVPALISNDWLYIVHNDTTIQKVINFSTVVDVIYNLWRMMYVDSNDNVVVSYQWYSCLFIDQTSIIWTFSWLNAMVQFQDFVLMMSSTRVWMIKKESVEVIDSEVIDVFKPVIISNLLWTFWRKSFAVYNQWLYLFTSAKRFVALTITPSWTDRYTVTQEDQWIYIQQYLDSIWNTNDVSIAINAEKIVFVNSSSTSYNMYIYDTYYKFWHRWDTELPIHGVVVFNNIYYLWDMVYDYDVSYTKDILTLDYTPYLKVIFGESDIFSLKNIITNKYYIWKNTDSNTKITRKAHVDWWKYSVSTTLKDSQYILNSSIYNANWTQWSTVLWYWIFWWYWFSASDYLIAWTNIIEIPISILCSLMEIEIEWDIEFWWMILWYSISEPVVTPINSVLWL